MLAEEFVGVYRKLANNRATDPDIIYAFVELKRLVKGTPLEPQFSEAETEIDMALAIDAVAATIHKNINFASTIFGNCDLDYIKKELDTLSGMEDESDVRRQSRGYFSTLKSGDDFEVL